MNLACRRPGCRLWTSILYLSSSLKAFLEEQVLFYGVALRDIAASITN